MILGRSWFDRVIQRNHTYLDPKMVKLRTLLMKANLVELFLGCSTKLRVDDKNLKALLSNISRLAQNAAKERRQLQKKLDESLQLRDGRLPGNLDGLISKAQKRFDLIDPQMQQVHTAISSSSLPNISFSSAEESFAVVKCIDDLLENMEELHKLRVRSIISLGKMIELSENSLRFLRKFIEMTKNWCAEHEKLKYLHIHGYAVIESTSCLLYLCLHDNEMEEGMKNELKIQCEKALPFHPDGRQVYIKALEASKSSSEQAPSTVLVGEHFVNFLDSLLATIDELKVSSTESVMHRVDLIRSMLRILKYYFVDPSIDKWDIDIRQMLKNLFLHIKVVACEAACVIYSCYPNPGTEYQVSELELPTSELLQDYNFIKQEAKDLSEKMVPSWMRSNFPLTNEHGFIEFVLRYLKNLLNLESNDRAKKLHHQIQEIYSTILSLRIDFYKIAERPRENEELKDSWKRFIDTLYHTEYVVDLIFIEHHYLWYHRLEFFVVMIEMKDIMEEINCKKDWSTDDIAVTNTKMLSRLSSNLPVVQVSDKFIDYMELFQDEAMKITEQLTNGMTQLYILSIVGMPGIGKTTLANAIYENHSVQLHFYVCARCRVSQAYQKRRLLLELLRQVSGRSILENGSDDDLAQKLYRSLKGKRYLILIDDLWDDWQWKNMQVSFPDDNNGSRILFTSRSQNIASRIGCKSITFPLHQLSDVKSWELLAVKLFQKESCPQELLQVGMQIATKCKGLPLALDLIAGILRNIERKEYCWHQVENSLSKQLLEDPQGRCMDVLKLSYNHLPDHLKPCFLYYGAFPEDKEVMTSKLSWLWIAEGFIQLHEDDNETLEDAAEKVLNDLIARSLVIVSKRRSDGGIKSSRLHDLLLEFALGKAKEEFFLQAGTLTLESNKMHVPYRLSANSRWDGLATLSKPRNLRTRSLLLSRFLPSNLLDDASKFLWNFGLLRVLDIGTIELQDFPDVICSLSRLKFLSLRYYSNEIPRGITHFSYLETLMLKVTSSSRAIRWPSNIWGLKSLRHLMVHPSCDFPNTSLEFDNLQTLSTLSFYLGDHPEKILRDVPNLRKLSCIFLNSGDDSSHCNHFPVFDFLSRLESLKVECRGEVQHPCVLKFPQNLRKLTLRNFQLPWSEVSTVGKLPNLQVLKLLRSSFMGDTWDMTEGEFLNLKFLKLESLDVEHWNVCEDYLPCLETLVVEDCDKLEIPHCLGEIPTLQKLELLYCKSSARISARIIQEKQQDFGNEQFVLTIKEKAAEDPYHHTSDNPEEELEEEDQANNEDEKEEELKSYQPIRGFGTTMSKFGR